MASHPVGVEAEARRATADALQSGAVQLAFVPAPDYRACPAGTAAAAESGGGEDASVLLFGTLNADDAANAQFLQAFSFLISTDAREERFPVPVGRFSR